MQYIILLYIILIRLFSSDAHNFSNKKKKDVNKKTANYIVFSWFTNYVIVPINMEIQLDSKEEGERWGKRGREMYKGSGEEREKEKERELVVATQSIVIIDSVT